MIKTVNKNRFLQTLALLGCCLLLFVSCSKTQVNQNEGDLLNVNLAGKWEGYIYSCTGFQAREIVEITQNGTFVTAVKTIGDACVTKGNVTFEGAFTENPFTVRFKVGAPTQPNSGSFTAQMELISPNLLNASNGIFFVRKETYYP